MEKNKLYLSIGHIMDGFLQSNIRIKLHNDMCYFRSRYHIDITLFASDFRNTNYLKNVSILAIHINDLLKNKINEFGGPYSADEFNMIPVVALRIAERFMSNSEEFSMYDITDLENVYRVCPNDRNVDYCNEEDDEDDEISLQDQIDDLRIELEDLRRRVMIKWQ